MLCPWGHRVIHNLETEKQRVCVCVCKMREQAAGNVVI